jgi:hypothetical protein
MNELTIHWNQIYPNGTEINDDTVPTTLLFANVHVHLSDLKNGFQRELYTFHKTTKQFGMKIPPLKSKVNVFKDRFQSEVKL